MPRELTENQRIARRLALTRQHYGRGHGLDPWRDTFTQRARRALGIVGTRYPKNMAREATVDGVRVRLSPSKAPPGRRTAAHRIQFYCPHCRSWQPVGRYGQHIVVHYPYAGRRRTRTR